MTYSETNYQRVMGMFYLHFWRVVFILKKNMFNAL